MTTIKEISEYLISLGITSLRRDSSQQILNPSSFDSASKSEISWLLHPKKEKIDQFKGSLLIVPYGYEISDVDNTTIIPCKNPKLAFIKVIRKFFDHIEKSRRGKNCSIYNTWIGDNVTIGHSCVIGQEGFGHEKDDDGTYISFPHSGHVIIEKDVEIGSGVHIQRGSLSGTNTEIKKGVRIWHMANIGHNCIIGERTVILNGSIICGSVKIGSDCWLSPGVTIMNKIKIGNNCIIGIGSVVTKDVLSGEVWAGNPARKIGLTNAYSHIMRSHRR